MTPPCLVITVWNIMVEYHHTIQYDKQVIYGEMTMDSFMPNDAKMHW